MFGEARQVIEVMKHEMAQKDDGCTRMVGILERQRHQFEDDVSRHALHVEHMTKERSQRDHKSALWSKMVATHKRLGTFARALYIFVFPAKSLLRQPASHWPLGLPIALHNLVPIMFMRR